MVQTFGCRWHQKDGRHVCMVMLLAASGIRRRYACWHGTAPLGQCQKACNTSSQARLVRCVRLPS
jgi:hypothetical protein